MSGKKHDHSLVTNRGISGKRARDAHLKEKKQMRLSI